MSSNLYQLETQAFPGQHVIIGKPYDICSKVMARQESGFHLIRGLGHQKPTEVPNFISTITKN